ncbi:hypothetical protein ACI8AC_17215 [Geodermatophilus sp. SYSU D00758]
MTTDALIGLFILGFIVIGLGIVLYRAHVAAHDRADRAASAGKNHKFAVYTLAGILISGLVSLLSSYWGDAVRSAYLP